MLKIYSYKNCGSCKKALKFLNEHEVGHKPIEITEKPPTKKELKSMLSFQDGALKKLFNTSGQVYRELNIKDKLADMSEAQAIDLLHTNPMLVKRPFVISEEFGLLGYKEDTWKETFLS